MCTFSKLLRYVYSFHTAVICLLFPHCNTFSAFTTLLRYIYFPQAVALYYVQFSMLMCHVYLFHTSMLYLLFSLLCYICFLHAAKLCLLRYVYSCYTAAPCLLFHVAALWLLFPTLLRHDYTFSHATALLE